MRFTAARVLPALLALLVATLAAGTSVAAEYDAPKPPRAWDDPERATAVPNILVWASTRTFVNLGYVSTLWQRPFGAMYFSFSTGMTGPGGAGRYQFTAPEMGVKFGSPHISVLAGWGINVGGDVGSGDYRRFGYLTKLLLCVQPFRHIGFIGGMAAFMPIGATARPEQVPGLEGILGFQLGF